MRRKKENPVFREYKNCWKFLKESKNFIFAIILIFVIFSFAGFFLPVSEQVTDTIQKFILEILEKTESLSYPELIRFILLNNLQSSFISLIFGVFLGIFPVLAAIANGYLIGYVSALGVGEEGIFILWRLLPHGIFELPAVFISLGLGLKLGTFIFQKKKFESFKNYFLNSLKVFFMIVLPLLIIAAIIEGSLIYFFR